ncbi:MAG: hypothetical protein K2Y25_05185 [Pseudomonadaceae bacterium]|jgi:hypothetical protein|nr:hypothetical protein [Pseudomonadaceae bacterium]
MSLQEAKYMKVRFINGTVRSFAFEPLTATLDPAVLLTHVNKALDSRRLVLQTKEQLLIIPFDNVESIEIAPAPNRSLPDAIQVFHEFL